MLQFKLDQSDEPKLRSYFERKSYAPTLKNKKLTDSQNISNLLGKHQLIFIGNVAYPQKTILDVYSRYSFISLIWRKYIPPFRLKLEAQNSFILLTLLSPQKRIIAVIAYFTSALVLLFIISKFLSLFDASFSNFFLGIPILMMILFFGIDFIGLSLVKRALQKELNKL